MLWPNASSKLKLSPGSAMAILTAASRQELRRSWQRPKSSIKAPAAPPLSRGSTWGAVRSWSFCSCLAFSGFSSSLRSSRQWPGRDYGDGTPPGAGGRLVAVDSPVAVGVAGAAVAAAVEVGADFPAGAAVLAAAAPEGVGDLM